MAVMGRLETKVLHRNRVEATVRSYPQSCLIAERLLTLRYPSIDRLHPANSGHSISWPDCQLRASILWVYSPVYRAPRSSDYNIPVSHVSPHYRFWLFPVIDYPNKNVATLVLP